MLASISADGIPNLQRRLVELRPDESVELPGVGYFGLHTYEGYVGRNPLTGEQIPVPEKKVLSFSRSVPKVPPREDEEPEQPCTVMRVEEKIGAQVARALEATGRAFVSGIGLFIRREKPEQVGRHPATGKTVVIPARVVTTFRVSPALQRRMSGTRTEPLPDERLGGLLDRLDARPMTADEVVKSLRSTDRDHQDEEPYPWTLPEGLRRLREACARADEGTRLAFGFIPSVQVEDALDDLGIENDGSPEWYPFSVGDGEDVVEPHTSCWVLRADEVGEADPSVFWANPDAEAPWASVPLSIWLRLHAFEALLLEAAGERWTLTATQAERIEQRITVVVPGFGGLWPEHDFTAALRLPLMQAIRSILPG